MNFHIGQKVVCIREDWINTDLIPHLAKKGGVYTVRHKYPAYGTTYLLLAEIVNPIPSFLAQEPAFIAIHFRPVTERKTDIEIFKRLLVPGTKILEPVSGEPR